MSRADSPLEPVSQWIDEMLWERLPDMPFGNWFDAFVDWAKVALHGFFTGVTNVVQTLVEGIADLLTFFPSVVTVLIFAGLAWWIKSWKFGLTTAVGLGVVAWSQYWEETMTTLALVLVASALALALAIPLGILAAENRVVWTLTRPVLDFMQTLPAFVYLIPAVAFFLTGVTPGVVATLVFCMPPGVRLTQLGLRQVDKEVVEAGESFGASRMTSLTRIKLPLALPSIMAGVNQVIMLALSMVVIAGMVGAPGLGQVIVRAFGRIDVAMGFTGGLCVVLLAIFLDRMSHALGTRTRVSKALSAQANP